MRRAPPALLWLLVLCACRRGQVTVETRPADTSLAAIAIPADAALADPLALRPARCHATAQGVSFEDGGPEDLEVGDAVSYAGLPAVAVVHRTSAGRTAAIVVFDEGVSAVHFVNLGPTLGDAPPPRLAACRAELIAATFEVPSAAARATGSEVRRSFALWAADPRPPRWSRRLLASVPQQSDESLASDVACSGADDADVLVVWDETVSQIGGVPRGVVRTVPAGAARASSAAHDVSPAASDADMPRVVKAGAGFFVFWIAHRPEASSAPEASADLEVTGEPRSYAWLEGVPVDTAGDATGRVRRLTPTSGHVSAYDVQVRLEERSPTILVLARDDGESADGKAGTLLRLRVRSDGGEPAVALATDGLGRGAPAFVEGSCSWAASMVTWVGTREELRLLPLDGTGAPSAAPSAEEGLSDARPLLLLGSEGRMLVATPTDRAAQLRLFTCRR